MARPRAQDSRYEPELVRRVVDLGALAGRELATPTDTRRMLGLAEVREPSAPC